MSIKLTGNKLFVYEVFSLLTAIFLCILILWFPMRLRQSDLRVPFAYNGEDDFAHCIFMKGAVDGKWFLQNRLIGAPFIASLHDFPINDNFSILMVKLIGLFTQDFGLIFNIFFLINYPLTTLITYLVLRHFKLSYPSAVAASLLYTFIPYHYSRAIGHCFYSVYYAVPLMTMVLLWFATNELTTDDLFSIKRLKEKRGKWLTCVATCLLISSTGGFYYAFFALFLLFIVALILLLRQRDWKSLVAPAIVSGLIIFFLALNVTPNLIYYAQHGRNEIIQRSPGDAEYAGLKIATLLLPVHNHPLPVFAEAKARSLNNPLTTENQDSTLGILGSLGFLFLLGFTLFRPKCDDDSEKRTLFNLISSLSVFNLASVLLATIGGMGSLFALLVWPQIRGYNRICVYLAFFSFFTVFLLLDYRVSGYFKEGMRRAAYPVLIAIILVLGLSDLLGRYTLVNGGILAATYWSDHQFVKAIEAQLPDRSMVFQLPYATFPETKGPGQMHDYDHVRGYFHSKRLRWSFGAMSGRTSDLWQQMTTALPLPQMVERVTQAGFSGIYLDRFGYEDQGKNIEEQLSAILNTQPLVSQDQRLSFYNLKAYQQSLKEKYSPASWEQVQRDALFSPLFAWQKGFYGLETSPHDYWRWAEAEAYGKIINPSNVARRITWQASFSTNTAGNLVINSSLFKERLALTTSSTNLVKTLLVPPGEHVIRFSSDAPPTVVPNDNRVLIFRVTNFSLKPAE